MSTPGPSLGNEKVKAFLEEYKKTETQTLFRDLADHTRQTCERLLKEMKIKGMVQSRSKAYDSLETKLKDMVETPEFINWVVGVDNGGGARAAEAPGFRARLSGKGTSRSGEHHDGSPGDRHKGRDIYEHPDMGDLAGVRIGLFFPGDVLKVAQKIEETFNVSHTFGTVTDTTRSAADRRNRDVQRHGDGRWISHVPGEGVQHWEHYGYKSWQVVVEGERTDLSRDPKPTEAALALTKLFGSPRAEIQVGTVVTQAWAEVQHNIIYKTSADFRTTPTMKRMIDAINGLAITTDIMLTELERSQDEAKREAEKTRKLEKQRPLVMLLNACWAGDHVAVKRLLKDGVDVNTMHRGDTAIHVASQKGHDEVVELLLAEDGVDIDAEDGLKRTALSIASEKGYDKVVELLVKNSANINIQDSSGRTAFHAASWEGHDKVVGIFVKNGADINSQDVRGLTALHIASEQGHDKVVELLVKNGADVSIQDAGRRTALHIASEEGHDKVVELLVKNGADVNTKDVVGRTAFHLASRKGHSEVVELLVGNGAGVNTKDVIGLTAFHLASEEGHEELAQRLKQLM